MFIVYNHRGYMKIKNFVDEVISCKNKTITGKVFLLIQTKDLVFLDPYFGHL